MKGLKLLNFLAIAAGAAVMGFGINEFNLANNLSEGGVTGLAILLKLSLDIEPWLTTLLINIPLLVIGWRHLGRRSLIYTLYGTSCLSFALWLFRDFRLPLEDPLLAALFAGVFVGAGLGVVFRFGGTTGGADIIARLAEKYLGWKMGRTMFLIDAGVLGLSLVHLSVTQVMYTVVAVFVGTRVIDLVQDAAYATRATLIVSDNSDEIARRIMNDMRRGVTVLRGAGAYTGRERDVLYVVVSRAEVVRLRNLIVAVDPHAFVTITDSGDVLGEGFRPATPVSSAAPA